MKSNMNRSPWVMKERLSLQARPASHHDRKKPLTRRSTRRRNAKALTIDHPQGDLRFMHMHVPRQGKGPLQLCPVRHHSLWLPEGPGLVSDSPKGLLLVRGGSFEQMFEQLNGVFGIGH